MKRASLNRADQELELNADFAGRIAKIVAATVKFLFNARLIKIVVAMGLLSLTINSGAFFLLKGTHSFVVWYPVISTISTLSVLFAGGYILYRGELPMKIDESLSQGEYDYSARPIWEEVEDIGKSIPLEEWKKLPDDMSINLDHYLYGAPKKDA